MKKKYTESDHNVALRWAKKIKLINEMGGKCDKCGVDDIFVLEFHHKNKGNKEIEYNELRGYRWSSLRKEIVTKCRLLCRNCHRELHCHNKRWAKQKIRILKLLNVFKCSKCGYVGRNFSSLEFHHTKDKKFAIGRSGNEWASLDKIMQEAQKCTILCSNCHERKQVGIKKFWLLKPLIDEKIKTYCEIAPKNVTKDKVASLLKKGVSKTEVAKILDCSTARVYWLARQIKKTGYSKVGKSEVINLFNKGFSQRVIAKKMGFCRGKVRYILNSEGFLR